MPTTSGARIRSAWSSSSCPVWSPSSTTMRSGAIGVRGYPHERAVYVVWRRGRARGRLPGLRALRGPAGGLLPARASDPLGDPGCTLGRRGGDGAALGRRGRVALLALRGRAHRYPRAARSPPGRLSGRGRLLLRGPHDGVGEGRRPLAMRPRYRSLRSATGRAIWANAAKRGIVASHPLDLALTDVRVLALEQSRLIERSIELPFKGRARETGPFRCPQSAAV